MMPAGQWSKRWAPRGMWTVTDLAEHWGIRYDYAHKLVRDSGVEYGVRVYRVMGPGGKILTRRLALFTPETVEYLTRWRAGYRLPQIPTRPAKEPRRKKSG